MGEKKKVRSRVYEIAQYEFNRLTGEDLNFNERTILDGLIRREKGLKNWAYILHDKDVYVEGDDIPDGKYLGDKRENHWHVILEFNNQAELDSVAKAFGVPENFVEKKTGVGAFYDCLYYLTHEDIKQQELGKFVYSRDEVKMPPLFAEENWAIVDSREEKRLKRLPQGLEVESYIKKIAQGKVTLSKIFEESPVLFSKNQNVFRVARRAYLSNSKPPLARVNYYMQGLPGTGKTTAAKALARTLFPDVPDSELFCVISQETMFENYDGQPILIWDDWRAEDLLEKFDRGMIWKIFAINPLPTVVNVKYSSVNLINSVNIMTSVIEFHEFMKILAGEYVDSKKIRHRAEDDNQGYRRFPVFLEIARSSYDLYASLSLTGGEYREYKRLAKVEVNMVQLAKNESVENQRKVVAPVAELHNKIIESNSRKEEIEEVSVNVVYDDEFKVTKYIPKEKRKEIENGYEYFYTEICNNCKNKRNALTVVKSYEGTTVSVDSCAKCKGELIM